MVQDCPKRKSASVNSGEKPSHITSSFLGSGISGSQAWSPTWTVSFNLLPSTLPRMRAMLLIAIFPLIVLSTQYFGNVAHFGKMAAVLAVTTICIAAAAHQAWSANLFTTVSDMFPRKAVGTVTGIGAMAGGLGGVVVQKLAGRLTDTFSATPQTAYLIMFFICAGSYLLAWGVIKTLVPSHRTITDL